MTAIGVVIAILVGLVILAALIYAWMDSRRSQQFEEHLDDHFEAITEHRIRRNYHQGG